MQFVSTSLLQLHLSYALAKDGKVLIRTSWFQLPLYVMLPESVTMVLARMNRAKMMFQFKTAGEQGW